MKCKCQGCDHRHLACHDTCKDYQEYRAEREAAREKKRILVSSNYYYADPDYKPRTRAQLKPVSSNRVWGRA